MKRLEEKPIHLEYLLKHTHIFKKHTHPEKISVSLSRVAKAICLKSFIFKKKRPNWSLSVCLGS